MDGFLVHEAVRPQAITTVNLEVFLEDMNAMGDELEDDF